MAKRIKQPFDAITSAFRTTFKGAILTYEAWLEIRKHRPAISKPFCRAKAKEGLEQALTAHRELVDLMKKHATWFSHQDTDLQTDLKTMRMKAGAAKKAAERYWGLVEAEAHAG